MTRIARRKPQVSDPCNPRNPRQLLGPDRIDDGNVSVNRVDHSKLFQQADDWISRINFKPANRKLQPGWIFMMVVLIKLPHHQKVDGKGIARLVARRKSSITIAVTAPVHDRAV